MSLLPLMNEIPPTPSVACLSDCYVRRFYFPQAKLGARPEATKRTRSLALKRIVPGGRLDRNPTQFGELTNGSVTSKASVAASLYTAKRHLRFVMHGRTVDVADARLDLPGDIESTRDVAAE